MASLVPYGFILVGGILLVIGLNLIRKGIQSKNWPKVEGSIRRSEVDVHYSMDEDGPSRDFSADIYYEYTVDGRDYGGATVKMGYSDVQGKGSSHQAVDEYPEGSTVDVYYDPDNPREAVLEPGIPLKTIIFMILAPLFIFIGAAIFLGT